MRQKIVVSIILGLTLLGAGLYGLYHHRIGQYKPYITTSIHISSFSDDYVDVYANQVVVETNPGFELVYVLLALAGEPYARSVDQNTPYYDAMMQYFKPYEHHQAVDDFKTFMNNNSLPTAAMLFAYDSVDNTLVFNDEHESASMHRFNTIIPELNRFMEASDFDTFYADYTLMYQETIDDYPVDLMSMWSWFEARGENSYDVLRLVTSPLLGSHHYTHRFKDHRHGGFEEMVAFVPVEYKGASQLPFDEDTTAKLLLTQMMFTEIAHHYVNPITDQHLHEVFGLMDEDAWYQGPGYGHAGLVFNEYMTWALFALYVYDVYGEHTALVMQDVVDDIMVNHRQFTHFKSFNAHTYDFYTSSDQATLKQIYDDLLRHYRKP